MRATLRKRWTFDAAHHLPSHAGKCQRLHGHTYTVEVEVAGPIRNDRAHAGTSTHGMVVDFADLSAIWKRDLEPVLDHQNLNATIGPLLPGPTTAENIAAFVLAVFQEGLVLGVKGAAQVESVTVWETPTGSATVRA